MQLIFNNELSFTIHFFYQSCLQWKGGPVVMG